MHPRYKALHWQLPALQVKDASLMPQPQHPWPNPLLLGDQPYRGVPAVLRTDANQGIQAPHEEQHWLPPQSLTYWKGLRYCFYFSNCIPCFASAFSPPPLLLSTPSLLCLCCTSLPRRSGLHVTPIVEAAAWDFPTELHGLRRLQDLSRKRPLQAVCHQPLQPWDTSNPTVPPHKPSFR